VAGAGCDHPAIPWLCGPNISNRIAQEATQAAGAGTPQQVQIMESELALLREDLQRSRVQIDQCARVVCVVVRSAARAVLTSRVRRPCTEGSRAAGGP
jgi:hypothetical protein